MKHSYLHRPASAIVATAAVLAGMVAYADPVEELVEFTAGSTARAGEVNSNFSAVASAVNDNDARIAALEAALEAQTEEIAALRAQLGNVLNVNEYLSLETVNDQPAVRLTGANLQIVNGMGETATSNGTGNLLIGYNERRDEALSSSRCSLGINPDDSTPLTNEADCIAAGAVWAINHTGGSHYLVVGPEHNYSRWGGIVVGQHNTSSFDFASVTGGSDNTASGVGSSVTGGSENTASGQLSSVSGGSINRASGGASSVSGGSINRASGNFSSVSGGSSNAASGLRSSVSGGRFNSARGESSSVSGGIDRRALDPNNWVAGSLLQEE